MAIPVTQPHLGRSAAVVALGGVVGNTMQYLLVAGLSRAFAPELFGALGALLGLALICSIPGTALQLVIGREAARRGSTVTPTVTFGSAAVVSVTLALVLWVLAPVARDVLHLDSVWPVLWLGLTLVPSTMAAALNGSLLGRERFGRFAAAQVLTSGCRLLVLPVVLIFDLGLTGTMAALCGATVLASLLVAVLVGRDPGWAPPRREAVPLVAQAAAGVSGFVLLSNIDLLLARHFLSPRDSGLYALASLFAKAGLWGTQFIAIVVYPRLARTTDRSLLFGAAAVTGAMGMVGAAVALLVAPTLVDRISGPAYASVADYAPLFVVLGTLLALVHLALVASIAAEQHAFARLLWAAAAAEAVVVALLPTPTPPSVGLVATVVCLVVAAVGFIRLGARRADSALSPA